MKYLEKQEEKMKKFWFVLSILVLVFFVSCGDSDDEETQQPADGNSETEENTEPEEKDDAENQQDGEEQETEEETTDDNQEPQETGKILVAYFSYTGNTKLLAQYAAELLGADLAEIVPAQPYTADDTNYNSPDCRARTEYNDPASRPAISGTIENMAQYDTVLIAHPIWYGDAPRIMDTFMESYDFSGKTLTTFCTSAQSPLGPSAENLKKFAPAATWLESRRFEIGSSKEQVGEWLSSIGLAK